MSLVIEQMLKSYDVEFENSNIRILLLLYKLYRLALGERKRTGIGNAVYLEFRGYSLQN